MQIELVLDVVSTIALDVKTAMEQIIHDICPHVHLHPPADPQNSKSESSFSTDGISNLRANAENVQDRDILTSSLNAVSGVINTHSVGQETNLNWCVNLNLCFLDINIKRNQ